MIWIILLCCLLLWIFIGAICFKITDIFFPSNEDREFSFALTCVLWPFLIPAGIIIGFGALCCKILRIKL